MSWILYVLFPAHSRRSRGSCYARGALWLFLAIWSARYLVVPVGELGFDPGWMHNVHLVFHEAGHAITAMICDNRTAVVFMGSGLQVLFPLIVAVAFYFKNQDAFSAGLGLWWAGHAALDVAPYIADARALELPLLGGGTGREIEGHDWEYLLTHWRVLEQDLAIAESVALIGRLLMVVALTWAFLALVYEGWMMSAESDDTSAS